MPLNDTGLSLIATTLQSVLLFGQLHSGFAGSSSTDNIAVAGRQPIHWTAPDSSGNFGLISQMSFTAGPSGGPVFSVTLWDSETDGVPYAECFLGGDATFNIEGEYQVTAIDVTETST